MGTRSDITVLLMEESRTAEIMLSGRVDRRADGLLAEALELLLTDPQVGRIEIDTALVNFCDRGGLTVFIRAQRQAAHYGVPLRIVRAAPLLQHVLKSTGLSQLLTSA